MFPAPSTDAANGIPPSREPADVSGKRRCAAPCETMSTSKVPATFEAVPAKAMPAEAVPAATAAKHPVTADASRPSAKPVRMSTKPAWPATISAPIPTKPARMAAEATIMPLR